MSLISTFLNSKEFSKLLIKGKDQAFLTPEDINDAIPANTRACIDQRMVHDDCALSNMGMLGNIGQGGFNHRKTCAHLL